MDSGGGFQRITSAVVFLHDLKKTSWDVSHTESWSHGYLTTAAFSHQQLALFSNTPLALEENTTTPLASDSCLRWGYNRHSFLNYPAVDTGIYDRQWSNHVTRVQWHVLTGFWSLILTNLTWFSGKKRDWSKRYKKQPLERHHFHPREYIRPLATWLVLGLCNPQQRWCHQLWAIMTSLIL